MAANEVHRGDVGTVFVATIKQGSNVIDISAATTTQLLFEKPDGSVLTKTATLTTDGTDGKLQYTTQSGDLDMSGQWRLQAYLVLGTWTGKTDVHVFQVHTNIGD